jgi:hypothetical protein
VLDILASYESKHPYRKRKAEESEKKKKKSKSQ